MNHKTLLYTGILALSVITLSACTAKDQLKSKVLNKIDQKVQEEKAETASDSTDEQMLKELDSSTSSDIDAQFNQLEDEIR